MVLTELFDRSQQGDARAKETLVEANLGLARMVAARFYGRNCEPEDLLQVASLGLIKAIDAFDPHYGVQFSTYAVPVIMGEVKRYLRDNTALSVSRSYKILASKATSLSQSIFLSTGQEPTVSELARQLSVTVEELSFALAAAQAPVSLETPYGDGELTLKDTLPDIHVSSDFADSVALKEAIGKLVPRDRVILYLRYFRGETQTRVAQRLGISQVQVSRLEKKMIERLRNEIM